MAYYKESSHTRQSVKLFTTWKAEKDGSMPLNGS